MHAISTADEWRRQAPAHSLLGICWQYRKEGMSLFRGSRCGDGKCSDCQKQMLESQSSSIKNTDPLENTTLVGCSDCRTFLLSGNFDQILYIQKYKIWVTIQDWIEYTVCATWRTVTHGGIWHLASAMFLSFVWASMKMSAMGTDG